MNSWTPLFSKIVDSSLWEEPDYVCKIFITMLALKDSDHIVRYDAYRLAQRARKTEKEVLDALRILSEPDHRRIVKGPHEGRRIKQVDDGWLVLNGDSYEKLMRKISRQVYQAKWAREHRAKMKNGSPLPGEEKYLHDVATVGQDEADRRFDAH